MAEPVGLAVGIIGLASLFSGCIQVFDLIEMRRTKDRDLNLLHQHFENQKMKFVMWGKSLGFDEVNANNLRQRSWATDPILTSNIRSTMLMLKAVFEKTDELQTRYGLTRINSGLEPPQVEDSAQSAFRGALRRMRSKARRNEGSARSFATTRWLVSDRRQFSELIDHIERLVNDLKDLTPSNAAVEDIKDVVLREMRALPQQQVELVLAAESQSHHEKGFLADSARQRLAELSLSYSRPHSKEEMFVSASEGRWKFQSFTPFKRSKSALAIATRSHHRKDSLPTLGVPGHTKDGSASASTDRKRNKSARSTLLGVPGLSDPTEDVVSTELRRTRSARNASRNDENENAPREPQVLRLAAADDSHGLLKSLLTKDTNVNAPRSHDLKSALLVAMEAAATENAHALARHPTTNVNAVDKAGQTALMQAIAGRDLWMIRILTDRRDVDLTIKDCNGMTALDYGLLFGIDDSYVVRLLPVRPREEILSYGLNSQQLVLWTAIDQQWDSVINRLADCANDDRNHANLPMLSIAIAHKAVHIVQCLITLQSVQVGSLLDPSPEAFFYQAVQTNSVPTVKAFLDVFGDDYMSTTDNSYAGHNPLREAVRLDHRDVVREIIKYPGAGVLCPCNGLTVIHAAIANDRHEIALMLIQQSPNTLLLHQEADLSVLLFAAVDQGWTDVARALIASGHVSARAKDSQGRTCLLKSVDIGRFAMALSLAKDNPDAVPIKDDHGRTLLLAVMEQDDAERSVTDLEALEGLIKTCLANKQHDVHARGYKGRSAVMSAIKSSNLELTQLIMGSRRHCLDTRDDNKSTPLHMAVDCAGPELVQVIMDKAPSMVNVKDAFSDTPLHAAANRGRADIVEALLKSPWVDLKARTQKAFTPLHIAVCKQHEEVVSLLVRHRLDLVLCEARGSTPLMQAALLPSRNIIKMLAAFESDEQKAQLRQLVQQCRESGNTKTVELVTAALRYLE